MAVPMGGYASNYYHYYQPSYGSYSSWGTSGSYGNPYGGTGYSGYYGSSNPEFYPQSFPLFAGMNTDANNQFYDSVIAPNMTPITDVPTYAPHADSPTEFYNTMIGPAVQDANQIYNNWEKGPTETSSNSDEMNYFKNNIDHITSEASSVYNQQAPEQNNKKALDILTANDNEVLKKIDTMGKHDGADNKISSRDLQAAIEKYPDQFTEEQLLAIKWMYQDHGALWDLINGRDSKATFDEIHEAKNSGELGNH
jgi:hypothetical protein